MASPYHQALRLEGEQGWNDSAAVAYLLSHQQEDGSFGNLFDTTQVLPVLLGRTLLNVTTTGCHLAEGEDGRLAWVLRRTAGLTG